MIKTNLCGMTEEEIRNFAGCDYSHAVSITNSLYKKRINSTSLFPGIPKPREIMNILTVSLHQIYNLSRKTKGDI